jgi:hypothetical protein
MDARLLGFFFKKLFFLNKRKNKKQNEGKNNKGHNDSVD